MRIFKYAALTAVLISTIGAAMAQDISITFAKKTWTAHLEDNALAEQFVKTLPKKNLTFLRFLEQEYYAEIPKLAVGNTPQAQRFAPGEIYYYEPWSTFVLFFKGGDAHSLYKIGELTDKEGFARMLEGEGERIRLTLTSVDSQ